MAVEKRLLGTVEPPWVILWRRGTVTAGKSLVIAGDDWEKKLLTELTREKLDRLGRGGSFGSTTPFASINPFFCEVINSQWTAEYPS